MSELKCQIELCAPSGLPLVARMLSDADGETALSRAQPAREFTKAYLDALARWPRGQALPRESVVLRGHTMTAQRRLFVGFSRLSGVESRVLGGCAPASLASSMLEAPTTLRVIVFSTDEHLLVEQSNSALLAGAMRTLSAQDVLADASLVKAARSVLWLCVGEPFETLHEPALRAVALLRWPQLRRREVVFVCDLRGHPGDSFTVAAMGARLKERGAAGYAGLTLEHALASRAWSMSSGLASLVEALLMFGQSPRLPAAPRR